MIFFSYHKNHFRRGIAVKPVFISAKASHFTIYASFPFACWFLCLINILNLSIQNVQNKISKYENYFDFTNNLNEFRFRRMHSLPDIRLTIFWELTILWQKKNSPVTWKFFDNTTTLKTKSKSAAISYGVPRYTYKIARANMATFSC